MVSSTYLYFNGQCEEAFAFYAQVLGGAITAKHPYSEMPEGMPGADAMKDKLMHIRLEFGSSVLMGGDAPPQNYVVPQGFSVSLNLADPAEAERLYSALAENGTVFMPLGQTFWAARFAMFSDRFGTPWMINCESPR